MADHPDFLRAVLANSDDDLPRLVYSDWLEESGVESNVARAEFIRAQCAMEGLDPYSPEWYELNERMAQLFGRYQTIWEEGVYERGYEWNIHNAKLMRDTTNEIEYTIEFRRGFLERLWNIRSEMFVSSKSALMQLAPIRFVNFRTAQDNGLSVVESDRFQRLDGACITLDVTEPDPNVVFKNDNTSHLRELEIRLDISLIYDSSISVCEMSINRWPYLPNLRRLLLPDKGIGPDTISALIDSPNLPALESFTLSYNNHDSDNVKRLACSSRCANLKELSLRGSHPGNDGLAALGTAQLDRLEKLTLTNEAAKGTEGFVALTQNPTLAGLKRLDLPCNSLSFRHIVAIVESPYLAGLRRLNLSMNDFDDRMAEEIGRSRYLRNLSQLVIKTRQLGPSGFASLIRSNVVHSIIDLSVAHIQGLRDEGIDALATTDSLPELRRLCLSNTNITSDGVWRLASSSRLPKLRELILSDCEIGDEGAKALLDSSHWDCLNDLCVKDCGIGESMLVELRKRFGSALRV